jgi:uncharacterized membrane protein YbhN (UPF0104 family)
MGRVEPSHSQRSVLLWLVVGCAISAAALYLATREIDLGDVASAIGDASPAPLAGGTVLVLLSYPFLAARWRGIAADLDPPRLPRMLEFTIVGAAVNNALPARLGEVARAVALSGSTRRPLLQSFGTVVVDRVADVLFFATALGVTAAFEPTAGWVRWIGVAGLALTLTAIAGLVLVAVYMARREGPPSQGPVTRHLYTLALGLRGIRTWGALGRALLLTVVAWTVWMAGLWLIADSIGIGLSAGEVLFTTGLLGLGSAVPSAPGYIGTYHWIAAACLELFDVPTAEALAFAVLLHAAWFIPTTVVGSLLMVRWGLGLASLRRVSLRSEPARA